jgi:hypothetical protein
MPIRFRCAYCNQLMGIATRKAGTVVTCPKCAGQVVVPTPDPAQAAEEERQRRAAGPAGAAVFEEDDEVQKLLEFVEEAAQPARMAPLAQPVRKPGTGAMPPYMSPAVMQPGRPLPPPQPAFQPAPQQGSQRPTAADVDLLPVDMQPQQGGIHLTPGILAIVLTLAGLALGLMFLLGFLLGRSTMAP